MQRSPIEGSGGKLVAGRSVVRHRFLMSDPHNYLRFVPEDTAVCIPPYILHRDARYFSPYPDTFIPERWLDENDSRYKTNTTAFLPFSAGAASCVGKNLALLELRMVVAALVQKFDIKFAEGYDPRKWHEELQDFMVAKVGKLPVVLKLRE